MGGGSLREVVANGGSRVLQKVKDTLNITHT